MTDKKVNKGGLFKGGHRVKKAGIIPSVNSRAMTMPPAEITPNSAMPVYAVGVKDKKAMADVTVQRASAGAMSWIAAIMVSALVA